MSPQSKLPSRRPSASVLHSIKFPWHKCARRSLYQLGDRRRAGCRCAPLPPTGVGSSAALAAFAFRIAALAAAARIPNAFFTNLIKTRRPWLIQSQVFPGGSAAAAAIPSAHSCPAEGPSSGSARRAYARPRRPPCGGFHRWGWAGMTQNMRRPGRSWSGKPLP